MLISLSEIIAALILILPAVLVIYASKKRRSSYDLSDYQPEDLLANEQQENLPSDNQQEALLFDNQQADSLPGAGTVRSPYVAPAPPPAPPTSPTPPSPTPPSGNSPTLQPDTLLQQGKYRVVRLLGSGGFGNTYEIEHVKLGRHLALKEFFMRGVCARQGCSVGVSVADNMAVFQKMKEKFYREAQRIARLQNAHIVEPTDFFEENGTAYYAMQLVDGSSLADVTKHSRQTLTEQQARDVLLQVGDALACLHGNGLYHLDIKPANIMLGRDRHVYLIDFGASKQLTAEESQTMTSTTGLCYTPGYAPLEQVNGNVKRIGPWTDFYALGATLYHLLTLQQPPEADDLMYEGEAAFRFPPMLSAGFRQLIVWMMKPRIDERPQSIDNLNRAVASLRNR